MVPVRASEGTGAQESAAVLAAVSVAVGREVSSTWSRFDSVRGSPEGSTFAAGAAGVSCAGSEGSVVGSGSGAGSGSLGGSAGAASADGRGSMVSAGFSFNGSLGLGGAFGAVACLSMLAHVFPAGAAALGASGAAAGCSAGAVVVVDGCSVPFFFCASQAFDSSVGTDKFVVSLRVPFVAG